jgi:hypothetical protein
MCICRKPQQQKRHCKVKRHSRHTPTATAWPSNLTVDNGMFQAHKWVDCCIQAKQGLTFAWVEAMVASTLGATGHGASQVEGKLLCQKLMFPDAKADNEAFYAFKTTANPDRMYLHQAMKEPDREQLNEAMLKEVKDQMDNKNFTVVSQDSVLANEPVMPTVWQMKQKRDIITQ